MSEEHGIDREAGRAPERPTGEQRGRSDFDELFDLLSEERRRYVLYCLEGASHARLSVSTLVERLSTIEKDSSIGQSTRREVEISLRHVHLPKLDDASIVEFDPDEAIVEYLGGERVEQWVTTAARAELDGELP